MGSIEHAGLSSFELQPRGLAYAARIRQMTSLVQSQALNSLRLGSLCKLCGWNPPMKPHYVRAGALLIMP